MVALPNYDNFDNFDDFDSGYPDSRSLHPALAIIKNAYTSLILPMLVDPDELIIRNTLQIFIVGWCESLRSVTTDVPVDQKMSKVMYSVFRQATTEIFEEGWKPDSSWTTIPPSIKDN